MKLQEKQHSSVFLAELNKKVLRNVPGAEIISQNEAIQKDQEKYEQDLDKAGSVFPPIPLEQVKHKTKQEKDRLELKLDLMKLDKRNKKLFHKISKNTSSSKNSISQTTSIPTSTSNVNLDQKKRKNHTTDLDTKKFPSKTKNPFFDVYYEKLIKKQHTNDSNKKNPKILGLNSDFDIIQFQKPKYLKNMFGIASEFVSSNMMINSGTNIKNKQPKNDSLFDMDIDSIDLFNQNDVQNIAVTNDLHIHDSQIEKKKHEYIRKPKIHLTSQKTSTNIVDDKNKNHVVPHWGMKKQENKYNLIEHENCFEITNKLKFE